MNGAWVWAGARAIGTAHLAEGLPCQDAFVCRVEQGAAHSPILIAALADGAGSAACAEVGAQLATLLVADIVSEVLMDSAARDEIANVLRHAIVETQLVLELEARDAARARSTTTRARCWL
jgi:serine/threonine protein phosphatase PrpC